MSHNSCINFLCSYFDSNVFNLRYCLPWSGKQHVHSPAVNTRHRAFSIIAILLKPGIIMTNPWGTFHGSDCDCNIDKCCSEWKQTKSTKSMSRGEVSPGGDEGQCTDIVPLLPPMPSAPPTPTPQPYNATLLLPIYANIGCDSPSHPNN